MNFEFSDEQNMIREQAQSFLKAECPPQAVRTVLDGDAAFDQRLWQKVVDMGWTATVIPEEYDGLGLSYLELSVIAEELGVPTTTLRGHLLAPCSTAGLNGSDLVI